MAPMWLGVKGLGGPGGEARYRSLPLGLIQYILNKPGLQIAQS
jgi:hypothetical protein